MTTAAAPVTFKFNQGNSNSFLNPVAPIPTNAGNTSSNQVSKSNTPSFLNTTPQVMHDPSNSSKNSDAEFQKAFSKLIASTPSPQILEVGASAGMTVPGSDSTTIPQQQQQEGQQQQQQQAQVPQQQQQTTAAPTGNYQMAPSKRFGNFNLLEALQKMNVVLPSSEVQVDVSDLDGVPGMTPELREKFIEERKRTAMMQNFFLRQEVEEKLQRAKEMNTPASVWLDKITPENATYEEAAEYTQALIELLTANMAADKAPDAQKRIVRVAEATASKLDILHRENTQRASDLEKSYQEVVSLKQRLDATEKKLEAVQSDSQRNQQYQRHQTSVVSPVATLREQIRETIVPANPAAQQQQQQVDPREYFTKLPGFGNAFMKGAVLQNTARPNLQRDFTWAQFHQEAFANTPDLGADPSFKQVYGNKVWNELKRPRS
jgi:hypothetical protein